MSTITGLVASPLYYPSLVVNLVIRFDEEMTTAAPAKTAEDKAGGGITAQIPSLGGDDPIVFEHGTANQSRLIGIVPKSASVQLPGYRQAGTFSVEVEFKDLPIDPRTIRSMGVAIHLDAVPAGDWADGMTGWFAGENLGRRKSIIQTSKDNLLIAGLADSIDSTHDDRGATVRFEGRDLRGLMLDLPIAAKTLEEIDLSKPIDAVVRHIVQDLHPMGGGIQVDVDPSEWGGIVPSPASLTDATRANLDAAGQDLRAGTKGEAQQVTFWDLITTYCFLVGAVPHFVGSRLRIRPAKALFDHLRQEQAFQAGAGSGATPFAGGKPREVGPPLAKVSEQITIRRLVYGRGIRSLKLQRKLGGVKVPTIVCTSYDVGGDVRGEARLLKVQWPEATEKDAQVTSEAPSGKAAQTDQIFVDVPNCKSKAQLLKIAEGVYNQVGRQELGGSVETKSLSSFGGYNQDPDLLRLRPGDPVEITVDASGLGGFPPAVSELTQSEGKSDWELIQELTNRIGDLNLASVLVNTARGKINQLQRIFRVNNVKFDWDAGSGVGIAFDFQNFVTARYDVESMSEFGTVSPLAG